MGKKQEKIDKGMSVKDVITHHPGTLQVFEGHGLGCAGCAAALFENIEQGAKVHGIDVDALIADLNVAISEG
jgi:hybrid cluster-associated redox disulfide protein